MDDIPPQPAGFPPGLGPPPVPATHAALAEDMSTLRVSLPEPARPPPGPPGLPPEGPPIPVLPPPGLGGPPGVPQPSSHHLPNGVHHGDQGVVVPGAPGQVPVPSYPAMEGPPPPVMNGSVINSGPPHPMIVPAPGPAPAPVSPSAAASLPLPFPGSNLPGAVAAPPPFPVPNSPGAVAGPPPFPVPNSPGAVAAPPPLPTPNSPGAMAAPLPVQNSPGAPVASPPMPAAPVSPQATAAGLPSVAPLPNVHPLAVPPVAKEDSAEQGNGSEGLVAGRGPPAGPGYEGQPGRELGGRGLYGGPMDYQGGQKARRDLEFENLGEKLAGVIMGCTDSTKQECLDNRIFGLPQVHWEYVKCIRPGMPMFLFSYTRRCLYGIFKAESEGQMHINRHAWCNHEGEETRFPAQVRITQDTQYVPLREDEYKHILNYYSAKNFKFELNEEQVEQLTYLFQKTTEAQPNRGEPDPPPRPEYGGGYGGRGGFRGGPRGGGRFGTWGFGGGRGPRGPAGGGWEMGRGPGGRNGWQFGGRGGGRGGYNNYMGPRGPPGYGRGPPGGAFPRGVSSGAGRHPLAQGGRGGVTMNGSGPVSGPGRGAPPGRGPPPNAGFVSGRSPPASATQSPGRGPPPGVIAGGRGPPPATGAIAGRGPPPIGSPAGRGPPPGVSPPGGRGPPPSASPLAGRGPPPAAAGRGRGPPPQATGANTAAW